jgi:hypothetical protein
LGTNQESVGIGMDEVVRRVAAVGFPGVLAVITISGASLTMGPQTVVMLATLSGPVGFVGGCTLFGITALITNTVAKYGIETVLTNIYRHRVNKGESYDMLYHEIDELPISHQLKVALKGKM